MEGSESDNERKCIEEYLNLFCMEECLDEALNNIVSDRPKNPYVALANYMMSKSCSEIIDVSLSSVVMNGRRCAVKGILTTNRGSYSAVTCYSQPSFNFRDYTLLEEKLKSLLMGLDPTDVKKIDEQIMQIVEIEQAESLSLSIACCRAAANHTDAQPYHVIGNLYNGQVRLPVPVVSLASRLMVSSNKANSQDITVHPLSTVNFENAFTAVLQCVAILSELDLFRGASAASHSGCVCIESASVNNTLKVFGCL